MSSDRFDPAKFEIEVVYKGVIGKAVALSWYVELYEAYQQRGDEIARLEAGRETERLMLRGAVARLVQADAMAEAIEEANWRSRTPLMDRAVSAYRKEAESNGK